MTGITTIAILATVEEHNTKQHEREESEVKRMEEGDKRGKDPEEEMMSREENDERQQRTEEDGKKGEEIEEDDDAMREVRTQTGRDDAMCHQPTPFDWATDVEQSISPVPIEHIDLLPFVSNQPAHVTTDNPTPAVGVDTVTDTTPTDPVFAAITPTNPAPILPLGCAPVAFLTPAARVQQDLSTLCSDMPNSWGTLHHHYSHPPRDFSSLRSGNPNPWSSLRYRNRRSYPLH
jgi:hypothetical protein